MNKMIWPVHPQIEEDELLSSWIARCAIGNGCKIYTYSKLTLPGREIWARDIDKSADNIIIEKLSEKTGAKNERIKASLLMSYKNVIDRDITSKGISQGILHLGIKHRKRKLYGMQYCPKCLSNKKLTPYFRKKWRLIYSVCCTEHECILLDRCPECQKPVAYHRLDYDDKVMFYDGSLAQCGWCKADLTRSELVSASKDLVNAQLKVELAIKNKCVILDENTIVAAYEFFPVLRNLMHISTVSKYCEDFQKKLVDKLNMDIGNMHKKALCLEFMSTEQRVSALFMAMYLMSNWPKRFIKICKSAKPGKWWILHDYKNIPSWMEEVLNKLRMYPR